jgi:hypothetical protein
MSKSYESVENSDIGELVRKAETDFTSGTGTQSSKYVKTDFAEDLNTIYAYIESKHISGETDSMGREKPFFNIVIAARNIWFRATDLDRKNIRIKAAKKNQTILSYIATALLQGWMRKENFGAFLNDWGLDLATFNSSVVKFVEADGELHKMVMSWNRLIVDQVNFKDNIKIEVLELTEAQLYQRKGYDKEMVEKLCDAREARETIEGRDKDQKGDYIKLYEVHGVLPLSYITGKEKDEDTYVQQMHVISFVASKEKGKFDDFTLVSGREEKDPYMLTSLLPATDGSISLNGSVKNLFQAQWMQNHTVKTIKDQLDLASKLIFQTSDGNFVGQNALTAIENGDILIHALNQPLTQINNGSHDIVQNQNFGAMWKSLSNEINGISESMLGANPPSGTAWRQTEALLQESHSLFEVMTENKGLAIEEMLRLHIIPFLKKKMDTTDEIVATLSDYGIDKIEAQYIKTETSKRIKAKIKDALLSGNLPEGIDPMAEQAQIKEELNEDGAERFLKPSEIEDKTWKDLLKDFEWDVEVEITGESSDKQAILTTLNTTLTTIVALQGRPMTPEEKLVFNKILTEAGSVSPVELSNLPAPVVSPVKPQLPASVGGGGGALPVNE